MRVNEIIEDRILTEDARIQHAEDFILWEGSQGAIRVLNQLDHLGSSKNISVKFDGSPAIYFGRLPDGQFVLTDKSGFTAKGYNGLATSAEELENMFLSRGKELNDARRAFAKGMAGLYDRFEKVVPDSFRGFVKGDLLYSSKPAIDRNNDFVFTPNTVTYHVAADSKLGIRISKSTAGIAVHSKTAGPNQPDVPLDLTDLNLNTEVMVIGPTFVEPSVSIDSAKIKQAKQFVQKYASDIDSFLDSARLAELKMSDVPDILYTYINAMVKSRGLGNLAGSFATWLSTSKVSKVKQEKLLQYINENSKGAVATFTTVQAIMTIKNEVVAQLDTANSPIRATINGEHGGEGYVVGDTKYVDRSKFSLANFEKVRS